MVHASTVYKNKLMLGETNGCETFYLVVALLRVGSDFFKLGEKQEQEWERQKQQRKKNRLMVGRAGSRAYIDLKSPFVDRDAA